MPLFGFDPQSISADNPRKARLYIEGASNPIFVDIIECKQENEPTKTPYLGNESSKIITTFTCVSTSYSMGGKKKNEKDKSK